MRTKKLTKRISVQLTQSTLNNIMAFMGGSNARQCGIEAGWVVGLGFQHVKMLCNTIFSLGTFLHDLALGWEGRRCLVLFNRSTDDRPHACMYENPATALQGSRWLCNLQPASIA